MTTYKIYPFANTNGHILRGFPAFLFPFIAFPCVVLVKKNDGLYLPFFSRRASPQNSHCNKLWWVGLEKIAGDTLFSNSFNIVTK